jgi:hypothetical protein
MRAFLLMIFWAVAFLPVRAQDLDTLTAALDAATDSEAKTFVWTDAGRSFLDRRRNAEALSCFEKALALSKKNRSPDCGYGRQRLPWGRNISNKPFYII